MDCQVGSRRAATWDVIDEAPQIKRLREEKVQSDAQPTAVTTSPQPPAPQQVAQPKAEPEKPVFYISAPIQGYTVNNGGGCRYLFF